MLEVVERWERLTGMHVLSVPDRYCMLVHPTCVEDRAHRIDCGPLDIVRGNVEAVYRGDAQVALGAML